MKLSLITFLFFLLPLVGTPSREKLKTLYNSLDPTSISQHLAFYDLYKEYPQGQQALKDAWILLLGKQSDSTPLSQIPLSASTIQSLVSLVNKPLDQEMVIEDSETLTALVNLSKRLPHTLLKGHRIWNEADIHSLPLEEIDVSRALFLSQFGDDRSKVLTYEGLIDLMALQILARLPDKATPEQKIRAINAFIFDEMGFRFPPHSLYAKDIDLYTFLPSVLDSRRGVCLGVSILYLCLSQRLSLPLEMITPPGHIYVRYHEEGRIINIETTARGIHIDCDEYLSVDTKALQQRTIKEVIGFVHFNHASVYWQNGEFQNALVAYRKAEPYMQNDPLLKELMGYILLLTGNQKEGERLLNEIKDIPSQYSIAKNNMAEDYLKGNVDAKGVSILFSKVDENRQSILAKKEKIEETLKIYPQFRSGIFNLAITWLQLYRYSEALETLERLNQLDATDPEVQYYLSVIYAQRFDYPNAWKSLHKAEIIVKQHQHSPKCLKELRRELINCFPE